MADLAIVGGGGWLGSAITERAPQHGWTVTTIGRSARPGIDVVVRQPEDLRRAIEHLQPRAVINCAGRSTGSAGEMFEANVTIVETLLEAAAHHPIRVVQLGSAAEYGDPETDAALREHDVLRPQSDYGKTKAAASMIAIDSGVDAVVARLFNVAGPNPPHHSFLSELMARVIASTDEIELWNAELMRDWLTIEVAIDAILALADSRVAERVVNVCSGTPVSHREFATALGRAKGKRIRVRSLEQPGIAMVVGDPTLLRTITGIDPSMTVDRLAAACHR